ncbi:ATP-binding protein [Sedimentibacter sp.]|uniref:ATP-binding protein n=1 Tax=Sedimentibacter sp. TaxID=1960295 RepID=UPI00289D4DED|nr:ATP-binding protein [Sedimentibacter sp.]
MGESQNIEWKESWRDEYLKWICGFANAQGGKIYIGTNDKGSIIGVKDSKKLLEDIPNKILTTMGIIADVNLLSDSGKDYIEISVSSSSYPVSYKGEYHYRSGSTKQQLKGAALTEFLILKTGFKWDAVPVDEIEVNDLDKESFDIFRREAIRSGRVSKEDLDMDNEELLDSLGLIVKGKLKRAAIMLFYRKPERLFSGCFVKIGKFGEGADLQYQDEIHGSLFIIADRIIDLIYLKYLKAVITYDKETRIETYPFPRDGVREAVFNALIHCNWSESIPIQIRIQDDAMYISNSCILPSDWTAETLMRRHKSRPYNPDIANVFFRAGYVETWGRGIQKICEACERHGIPTPEYEVLGSDITVKFVALSIPKHHPKPQHDVLDDVLENNIIDILRSDNNKKQKIIAEELGISVATVQRIMKRLVERGKVDRKGGKRFGYWEIKE